MLKLLEKNLTRDSSLIGIQGWYEGATQRLKNSFGLILFPEQLYLFKNGAVVFYRDNDRLYNLLPRKIAKIFSKNPKIPSVIFKQLSDSLKYFKSIKINKQTNVMDLLKYLTESKDKFALGFAGVFMTFWIPILQQKFQEKGKPLFNQTLVKKIIKWREAEGNIFYNEGVSIIYLLLREIAQRKRYDPNLLKYITLEELTDCIKKQKPLPLREIEKRKSLTFAYINNRVVYEKDLKRELKISGYKIRKETTSQAKSIKGNPANGGYSQGKVKIVFSREDLAKVKEGDILVSPMTSPWCLPAIKKAAAIITDEGGITCHAAIVSRELNKPCVIGTKIATKVLKDGDLVEVNASLGVIRKVI